MMLTVGLLCFLCTVANTVPVIEQRDEIQVRELPEPIEDSDFPAKRSDEIQVREVPEPIEDNNFPAKRSARSIEKRSVTITKCFGSDICATNPAHSVCSKSGNPSKTGISKAQKEQILRQHNDMRAHVTDIGQPAASDMQAMVWDDCIALIAQTYADHCVYAHDKNDNRGIPGVMSAGQNLARGYGSWQAAINGWHSEYASFTYGVGKTGSDDIGHYTQLVWAKSTHLGCGFAVCDSRPLYVCNYGPAGNFNGMTKPYQKGPPQCTGGLCNCQGKLCKNGGTLNVKDCTCKCKSDSFNSEDCSFNCKKAEDKSVCGNQWPESYCKMYSNVPTDCPNMCGKCKNGQSLEKKLNSVNLKIDGDPSKASGSSDSGSTNAGSGSSNTGSGSSNTGSGSSNSNKCNKCDDANCNQPDAGTYWAESYCSSGCPRIAASCPALCHKCTGTECKDASGNKKEVGDIWIGTFGKYTCTTHGVQWKKGCVKDGKFYEPEAKGTYERKFDYPQYNYCKVYTYEFTCTGNNGWYSCGNTTRKSTKDC